LLDFLSAVLSTAIISRVLYGGKQRATNQGQKIRARR